jgi:hypothetical protein
MTPNFNVLKDYFSKTNTNDKPVVKKYEPKKTR